MTKGEPTELLQHTMDAIERSQAIIELSMTGIIVRANHRFLSLFDYCEDELVGQSHSILLPSKQSDSDEYVSLWNQLRGGRHVIGEFFRVDRSHIPIWIHGTYCPLLDASGSPYRVIKFATDVTARKRRDANIAGQLAAIRISQAVAEFSLDGMLIDANSNFLAILGYSLDEVIGRHHSSFVPSEERCASSYHEFWHQLRQGQHQSGLYKRIGPAGRIHWIQASYNPVRDECGRLTKIVKFANDQTATVEAHMRVEYLSRHDTLTGLANRTGLQCAAECRLRETAGAPMDLILIDLDRFKSLNDTHGHLAGDFCLSVMAGRIKEEVPQALIAARLGGDEFAVLLDGAANAEVIAGSIVKALEAPFLWDGIEHSVGASVGLARGSSGLTDLLRKADTALYEAKRAGRSTYRIFEPTIAFCELVPSVAPQLQANHNEEVSTLPIPASDAS